MSLNGDQAVCDDIVGIVTLVGNFNYGNRLQAFATCRIYSKIGFLPVQLELAKRFIPIDELKKIIKKLLRIHIDNPEKIMSPERINAFRRFNSQIISRSVNSTRDDYLGRLSYVSVGSDQVWNPFFIKHYEDWFMAEFVPESRRIALAPSIGLSDLEPKQRKWLGQAVKGFPRLSIRDV